MAEKKSWYAWALWPEVVREATRLGRLSLAASEGFEYARRLAENRRERRAAPLLGDVVPTVLTVGEVARDNYISPVQVHARIKQAREELFGRRGASAIYRARKRGGLFRVGRKCLAPDCARPLPANATARRRFCCEHASPRARVRRHRLARREPHIRVSELG